MSKSDSTPKAERFKRESGGGTVLQPFAASVVSNEGGQAIAYRERMDVDPNESDPHDPGSSPEPAADQIEDQPPMSRVREPDGIDTRTGQADALTAGSFSHEALLYAGDHGFLDGTVPFIRQGVAAGEPILVVVDARKIDLLRERLGEAAGGVHFADMSEVGTNPARIIPAWRGFVDEHAGAGPLRGIGEPIWAARSPAELVECQRHESLLNLAFADAGAFRLLCPYDAGSLETAILEEAHRSHRVVVEGGDERDSSDFRSLEAVAAPFDQPLPAPPSDARTREFGSDEIAGVRDFVRRYASDAGLDRERTDDLVLSVSEVATNSVKHGGGRGLVIAWQENTAVICEVRDAGRIEQPLVGRERPGADQERGRGLWIANQFCELVQIRSSADGNVVRLHVRLG
jgi:anti-sigma regulatory factor (Ser/Thr protein kinase)